LRGTDLTLRLARALDISGQELKSIHRGALLHDIGKIGISDAVLLKPGALTDSERAAIKLHPQLAYKLLSPIKFLENALDIPYCHHEKWDGTGYPRGLKGTDIPLAARIFAVADVYDAMTSNRVYRSGMPRDTVLQFIEQESGKYFDPKVVETFLKIMRAADVN
jgi:HD-GYP domain-containing protein (c-di-GMP phosphodiesterase class II)